MNELTIPRRSGPRGDAEKNRLQGVIKAIGESLSEDVALKGEREFTQQSHILRGRRIILALDRLLQIELLPTRVVHVAGH